MENPKETLEKLVNSDIKLSLIGSRGFVVGREINSRHSNDVILIGPGSKDSNISFRYSVGSESEIPVLNFFSVAPGVFNLELVDGSKYRIHQLYDTIELDLDWSTAELIPLDEYNALSKKPSLLF